MLAERNDERHLGCNQDDNLDLFQDDPIGKELIADFPSLATPTQSPKPQASKPKRPRKKSSRKKTKPAAVESEQDARALEPIDDNVYSVAVTGEKGLSIRVRPTGSKEYRFRYAHPTSKERIVITLGKVGIDTLDSIRKTAGTYRKLLAQGIDPKEPNSHTYIIAAPEGIMTFADVAQLWLTQKQSGKRKYSANTVLYWERCIRYLNEYIGDKYIDTIEPMDLLNAIYRVQNNDAPTTGQHMRQYAEDIFGFALTRKLVNSNTALQIRGQLLPSGSVRHHPAITKPDEFANLMYDLHHPADILGEKHRVSELTLLCLQILPHLYPRSIDMRSMVWSDISFTDKLWIFSPKKGEGREDMVDNLIVPLSEPVLALLEQLKSINGNKPYVFNSKSKASNTFIDRSPLNVTLDRLGYANRQCPHGFRASAKTMQMEVRGLRYNAMLTEMQLGHKIADLHGTAYNRLDEIDARIEMMQNWSRLLDSMSHHQNWQAVYYGDEQ